VKHEPARAALRAEESCRQSQRSFFARRQ
jgi:hypothetical protein